MSFVLRDYQDSAVSAIHAALKVHTSTLIVLPTGCGKTQVFTKVVADMSHARCLVIAHREELIFQAADRIKRVTGAEPGIEMAEFRANRCGFYGDDQVVVASVQTLNSKDRIGKFDPTRFGLLVIDEAHHSTAASYRRVIQYFRQNANLKVLGVTATPDRADEAALGNVFDSVAFDYEVIDAINDGWLCPLVARAVTVSGLDLSSVRTTAGDLNGADLAAVMEYENVLHEIAHPTFELTKGKKVLVFAASVAHAERLSEIFNRYESGCSAWISGATPKEDRRRLFSDYAAKRFRILVNVGVATEGFDDPGIGVVVMARPTKSRALYAQMAGRGTRTLPGTVDRAPGDLFMDQWGPDQRRAAIAASAKPCVEIIDFVGNSGKHKLITTADILGGERFDDQTIDLAKKNVEEAGKLGKTKDMLEALNEAQTEMKRVAEEAKKEEAARRTALRVKAEFSTTTVDPFNIFDLQPDQERGWDKSRPPSEKQLALLERQGIHTEGMSYTKIKQLVGEITSRWDKGLCSYKQARMLAQHGYRTDVSRQDASEIIDSIITGRKGKQNAPRIESALAAGVVRY